MPLISFRKKGRTGTMLDEADELIGIRDAAKRLGVHPSTLRNWDRAGRLKAVRVGSRRDRRFKKAEVLAEAQAQRRDELVTAKDLKQAARLARQGSSIADIAKAVGTTPVGLNDLLARCQAAVDALGPSALAGKELRDSVAHAMDVMDPLRAVDSQLSGWLTHLNAHLTESLPRFGELFKPILWEQKLFGDQMRDYLSSVSGALSSKLYEQLAATQAELFSTQAIATLAGSFKATDIVGTSSLVWDQITANIGAYQDLTRAALWDLNAMGLAGDKRLPFAEMKLAGGLLASATSLAADFRTKAGEAGTTAVKKPNVFRYFHDEAREVREPELLSDLELEAQLRDLGSFRAGNAGLDVVESWGRANRAAQLVGRGPIFEPSVDGVVIAARLPLWLAGEETELSDVVDGLYKLIFEASGNGSRLRTLAEPHEYATVQDILILRNYYRHDLAQGASAQDLKRRFRRVGDVFERLVGRRNPSGAADWQTLCLALMRRAEDFLRAIADKLEGRK